LNSTNAKHRNIKAYSNAKSDTPSSTAVNVGHDFLPAFGHKGNSRKYMTRSTRSSDGIVQDQKKERKKKKKKSIQSYMYLCPLMFIIFRPTIKRSIGRWYSVIFRPNLTMQERKNPG